MESFNGMNVNEFLESARLDSPPTGLTAPLAALWWDTKGDWAQGHSLVDELETKEGMAVHAYLHRKEGSLANADYWYARAGRTFHRPALDDERKALVEALLPDESLG
jgi:hypothetical protein